MTDVVRLGLLSAYRKLLQPLVRILIRNGDLVSEFSEILKTVFVEVAERDFSFAGAKDVAVASGDSDGTDAQRGSEAKDSPGRGRR